MQPEPTLRELIAQGFTKFNRVSYRPGEYAEVIPDQPGCMRIHLAKITVTAPLERLQERGWTPMAEGTL